MVELCQPLFTADKSSDSMYLYVLLLQVGYWKLMGHM